MWIWYVSRSSHGNVDRIAGKAHAARDRDGADQVRATAARTGASSRPALVARSRRAASTSAPGSSSTGAARKEARRRGGRGQARRRLPGDRRRGPLRGPLPAGLHLHAPAARADRPGLPDRARGLPLRRLPPGLPYSVFLGPGGAQYNLPQLYWKTIGDTVDTGFVHTYVWNRAYERPIMPLGPGLPEPEGEADPPLPAAGARARHARGQLVVVAARRQAPVEGGRRPVAPAAG